MSGRQAIGAFLIAVGLLLLVAALLNRVGSTFGAIVFGAEALREAGR